MATRLANNRMERDCGKAAQGLHRNGSSETLALRLVTSMDKPRLLSLVTVAMSPGEPAPRAGG